MVTVYIHSSIPGRDSARYAKHIVRKRGWPSLVDGERWKANGEQRKRRRISRVFCYGRNGCSNWLGVYWGCGMALSSDI